MGSNDDEILATFKILIIGESGVGKSSLLLRFTDDRFDQEMAATIGVDFKGKLLSTYNCLINDHIFFLNLVKQLEINNNRVKLAIWVTLRYFIFLLHWMLFSSRIQLVKNVSAH